jgi:hypothetical protein
MSSDHTDSASTTKPMKVSFRGGFSLEQIDPVEAKCTEIRNLLKGSEPLITEEIISKCITRENLLLFLHSYGKDYLRNFPILHSPSFNLTNTPSILLLSMFCVGASYCEGVILPSYVLKLAMRVLLEIEHQPVSTSTSLTPIQDFESKKTRTDNCKHETSMQVPSLTTIQSSILVCPVLVCSRDQTACKFVAVHFARNIDVSVDLVVGYIYFI